MDVSSSEWAVILTGELAAIIQLNRPLHISHTSSNGGVVSQLLLPCKRYTVS
jgi:hypothetical protein